MKKIVSYTIIPAMLACVAFFLDSFVFYYAHYPLLHTMSCMLILTIFYKNRASILINLLFLLCFWQLAYGAPHGALLLFCIYQVLVAGGQKYIYYSPHLLIALSLTGVVIETILIRLMKGYWPVQLTLEAVSWALLGNIVAIILISMLYYRYGKQGNR